MGLKFVFQFEKTIDKNHGDSGGGVTKYCNYSVIMIMRILNLPLSLLPTYIAPYKAWRWYLLG